MLMERYIDVVLKWRWPVIGLAVTVMLMMAIGNQYLVSSNEYRHMFDEDNPQLIAFDALKDTYSSSNVVIVAIAPRTGTVFTRESLGAIEEFTETAWQTPHSTRVDSLTNFSHSWARSDELVVEPLVVDAHSLDDDAIARVREIALGERELVARLIAHDGRVAGLIIDISLTDERDKAIKETTDFIYSAVEQARAKYPGLTYHVTGDVVLNRALSDAMNEDFQTLGLIAFLLILLICCILLRSFWATVAVLVTLAFSVMAGMGFAGWTGMLLSGANATAPMIMMTVVVAHAVHIVSAVLSGINRGLQREEAVAKSLRTNMWPVFLTTVTTMIGFLSLNFSDAPPFRILGNLASFGVFCGFVFSVTLLPSLLSLMPLRAGSVYRSRWDPFDRLGDFVVTYRRALLWIFALVFVFLAAGIPRNELSEKWTKLFDESYEYRRATDFVTNNLTGLETLEYSLASGVTDGISDIAYLERVEAFADWFRDQPEVSTVQAFPDIVKRLHKNMHADDPAYYRLPSSSELAAQYLLLYELSLPFGSDLNNRIDVAKSASRMTVVLRELSTVQQIELAARAQSWLKRNAPELKGEATGFTMLFAHLAQITIESMLRGTMIAMIIVSLILMFIFRSVRYGLVSLIPNFVPAIMAFGIWGWLVGYVGMAGSIVTAMAFGIVVDDTIHFMTKYLKARQDGKPSQDAVRFSFRAVGPALTTTTLVFAAGFAVFGASDLVNNRALGLLVALIIAIALLADFLLFAPLLTALDRKKKSC